MDATTVAIGGVLVLYGLLSIPARVIWPDSSRKLIAMRQRLGHRAGTLAHVVFYTVLPLCVGLLMLVAGVRGRALF